MHSRNDPCWCGGGKKWKKCHYPVVSSHHSHLDDVPPLFPFYQKKYGIILKTKKQIEGIRKACHITVKILNALCASAKAGVTTNTLDALSLELHKRYGATPAPLGYGDPPYPKSICTSINDVICHGIPDDHPLQEGDILNIDVSAIVDGFYGDSSQMVMVGSVTPEKQHLVYVAHEALMRSINILRPGMLLKDIGDAIESYARKEGCSVVNQFVGHGVGLKFHEAPEVPHHYNHSNIPLAPGMIFTIEPMINLGVREAVIDADGWTARTADGNPSAQWEHTVLITENSHEILTLL